MRRRDAAPRPRCAGRRRRRIAAPTAGSGERTRSHSGGALWAPPEWFPGPSTGQPFLQDQLGLAPLVHVDADDVESVAQVEAKPRERCGTSVPRLRGRGNAAEPRRSACGSASGTHRGPGPACDGRDRRVPAMGPGGLLGWGVGGRACPGRGRSTRRGKQDEGVALPDRSTLREPQHAVGLPARCRTRREMLWCLPPPRPAGLAAGRGGRRHRQGARRGGTRWR